MQELGNVGDCCLLPPPPLPSFEDLVLGAGDEAPRGIGDKAAD